MLGFTGYGPAMKLGNRRAEVIRLWRSGMPTADLAERLRCNTAALRYFGRRHNLKWRRRPAGRKPSLPAPNVAERIIFLRKRGKTAFHIANKLRVNPHIVSNILEQHDLRMPSKAQRRKILKRVNAKIREAGLNREKIKGMIRYRRASTELFVHGEGLVKYLPRLAKVLKVKYEWLLSGR